MKAGKRGRKREPWHRAWFRYRTVRDTMQRLSAVAKKEGMTINAIIGEAVHKHLFALETRGDPRLRRKSVCWSCGKMMDDAAAKKRARRRRNKGSEQTP